MLAERKRHLITRLGLDELAERLDDSCGQLGLHSPNCLERLSEGEALSTLLIEESGTTGMYGSWSNAKSKMYLALATFAYHDKPAGGSGGSFGYGKSGLIRGSAVRTVVAYTCFRERADASGVTRRLLGMAYWGQHHVEDRGYTGFGRFGHTIGEDQIVPFENEKADEIASAFDIPVRRSDVPEQLGTTFLLLGVCAVETGMRQL